MQVTRFKLGHPKGPSISGIYNNQHDYVITAEFERPSPLRDERRGIGIRLSEMQVFNREPSQVAALPIWIAVLKIRQHFASGRALEDLPRVFTATKDELDEYYRQVDPRKVRDLVNQWIALDPPDHRGSIGFIPASQP